MNAPVVLFTYSRAENTDAVLQSLSKNYIAEETDVYAYICKPRDDKIAPLVQATKNILLKYSTGHSFKSFNIIENDKWIPLGPGLVDAVTETLEKYDKVIVVEDDLITSVDFLTFMNDALDYYENENSIFSISGYSFGADFIKKLNDPVYFVRRNNPWGWATWKNRWAEYKWIPTDYLDYTHDRKFRKTMKLWAKDLPMLMDALFMERDRPDKDWEQQFRYAQCINNAYTVCPKISKVKNIGFTGMRTNESPVGLEEYFEPGESHYSFTSVKIDDNFQRKYNNKFIFGFRHRFMLMISESVYRISPALYYRFLKLYYKSDKSIEEVKETFRR